MDALLGTLLRWKATERSCSCSTDCSADPPRKCWNSPDRWMLMLGRQ
eukprot:SAG11_NODE_22592_length_403_cov_0.851974_1_plen_46_part_01